MTKEKNCNSNQTAKRVTFSYRVRLFVFNFVLADFSFSDFFVALKHLSKGPFDTGRTDSSKPAQTFTSFVTSSPTQDAQDDSNNVLKMTTTFAFTSIIVMFKII